MHILYLFEISLLLAIEIFLGTGSSSAGHHIDEAVGMFVDFADTSLAGFGGDEHDDTDVVTVGNRFIRFFVILERKIGNNNAVDTTFYAFLTESLEPEFHDRVEIPHQDERNTDIATDIAELLKQNTQRHTVAKSTRGSFLDNNAVSHRVTEGNTDFNRMDPIAFEGADDVGSTFQGWTTSTEVDGQQVFRAVLKKLIYTIHDVILNLIRS